MADDGESLESWLNKATNPSNRQEDWEYIMGFCDQINKELEGPQISVRLLAHKIQSPQEWEAMQALTVLGACMKNCGRRFHNEVAKFRFLNELIKVVSPKYLGDRVSDKVKTKVIEILYSWTVSLPDEAKICEAYQMLKSQGIVSVDPEVPLDATLIPSPSPRPKNPVFDDEKKSKRLADLLKSKKPEDLQEANRLIKNMVKEDEARTQRATKQKRTLEAVQSSVKLLNEMLAHFNPQDSTDADKELIKDLYGDCDKLRQTVFQLATETEDNDSSLGDILQASDDLSHVMNSYKRIVEGQAVNGEAEEARHARSSARQGPGSSNQSEILIDLVGLDVQSGSLPQQQQPPPPSSLPADLLCEPAASEPPPLVPRAPSAPSAALSLLDEELLSLGLNEPTPPPNKSTSLQGLQDSGPDVDLFDITSSSSLPAFSSPAQFPDSLSAAAGSLSPLKSLNFPASTVSSKPLFPSDPVSPTFPAQPLGSMLDASFPHKAQSASLSHNLQDLALLDLCNPDSLSQVQGLKSEALVSSALLSSSTGVASASSTSFLLGGSTQPAAKTAADDSPLLRSLSPVLPPSHASPARLPEASLANVFVPLEAIKPSHLSPVTAYDKNGVRVLLHFATNCPAGRPDVLVMVASMLNTAPLPVRDIVLQAAVPKMMKVRLQPPSGTELAPFNPILPPAAVTQVILLANPLKEKVRMRYKLMFTLGEMSHTEVGEVNEFPPADRWGAL